ncbi:MAG: hypothetical protein PHN55_06480 [Dysgonamonadaceae bacterium]|nr:hypothetical protein [Dysgonamonadaceae bacterium]
MKPIERHLGSIWLELFMDHLIFHSIMPYIIMDLFSKLFITLLLQQPLIKNKKKEYNNFFGRFLYRDIPNEAYPLGVKIIEENNRVYQIATPEKALCDKLYSLSPVSSVKRLKELLFNDLRIDEDMFYSLNFKTLKQLTFKYRSSNLKLLSKFIENKKNNIIL